MQFIVWIEASQTNIEKAIAYTEPVQLYLKMQGLFFMYIRNNVIIIKNFNLTPRIRCGFLRCSQIGVIIKKNTILKPSNSLDQS